MSDVSFDFSHTLHVASGNKKNYHTLYIPKYAKQKIVPNLSDYGANNQVRHRAAGKSLAMAKKKGGQCALFFSIFVAI